MKLSFSKYQGAGNDFIMLDNFDGNYDNLSISDIQQACDRKFGIGADGLILLQRHPELEFEVRYYNADGTQSFCGNGARCAVAFAGKLGLLKAPQTRFLAIDGIHEAWLCETEIKIKMADVHAVEQNAAAFILNTGSPHYVILDEDHSSEHVTTKGQQIRYSDTYKEQGINVNLLKHTETGIQVATYERGVEAETLSCGTGVTAAALVYAQLQKIKQGQVKVLTKGGELAVQWQANPDGSFSEIYLIGPAQFVFSGIYEF
ncbi:MAG: diaminopimelate epimerase [Flavobacteriales bacterium]